MSRTPGSLPTALGDVFSVRAARLAGVSVRRLRSRDLESPFHGVRQRARTPDPPPDPERSAVAVEAEHRRTDIERRTRAYATVAPEHTFAIGVTAAVVYGLPLPLRALRGTMPDGQQRRPAASAPPRDLDIGVLAPHRAARAAGVRGRQLRPALSSVRRRAGLQVASPASIWAQLAVDLTVDELVALGDAIVHIPRRRGMLRGTPADALGTIAQLDAAMNAGRRPGIAKLRAALPQIRVGSASPQETDLRLACVRSGFPEPELDVDIVDDAGRPIGFTEIAFAAYRVLVEYEGDHHRVDRTQWNRDIEKHAACRAAGWDVVRITAEHVSGSAAPALALIRAALVRGGWQP